MLKNLSTGVEMKIKMFPHTKSYMVEVLDWQKLQASGFDAELLKSKQAQQIWIIFQLKI